MPIEPYSITAPLSRRLGESLLIVAAVGVAGACAFPSAEPTVDEVFEAYTEGIVTEVVEVAPDEWRISDETVVPDTNATKLIARRLDGSVDTISGAALTTMAGQAEQEQQQHRSGGFGLHGLLLYGLIGRRLFAGSGGGYAGPRAGAYVNQGAYTRTQQTAGTRLNASSRSRTVTRPIGGRSGFGSGRAGRGFGG